MKIAILGVCNTRNVVETTCCFNIVFYGFQTCFLDITESGLNIPLKDFFRSPIIPKNDYYAEFTRRTMFCDLNKTALSTIESLNPDYFLIDLSSLYMRTYKVSFNNKSVYSHNAYSPDCYEYLSKDVNINFEKVTLSDIVIKAKLYNFVKYLQNNWDLNKLIVFNYTKAAYYINENGQISLYPDDYWGVLQQKQIANITKQFIKMLDYPSLKIYNDADVKVCKRCKESGIPSMFHYDDLTKQYQALLFKQTIFENIPKSELQNAKDNIIKFYNLKFPSLC